MESTNISVWDVARSELNFETPLTRTSWRFYPHFPALYLTKRNSGICANCPGMLLFSYLKWNQGNKLCQDDPGGLELWSLGTTQLVRVLLDFKKTPIVSCQSTWNFLNGNKCFSLHSETTPTGNNNISIPNILSSYGEGIYSVRMASNKPGPHEMFNLLLML